MDNLERAQILTAAINAAQEVAINRADGLPSCVAEYAKQTADAVVAACLSAVDTLNRRTLSSAASSPDTSSVQICLPVALEIRQVPQPPSLAASSLAGP